MSAANNTPMTIDELRCDEDFPVDIEDFVEEYTNDWQFGKDLKREKKNSLGNLNRL